MVIGTGEMGQIVAKTLIGRGVKSLEVVSRSLENATQLAKEMGPGKKIITILCDDANKYYDKMFNKKFLISKDLPVPDWI